MGQRVEEEGGKKDGGGMGGNGGDRDHVGMPEARPRGGLDLWGHQVARRGESGKENT